MVTNVKWGGGQARTVAYVATMNGSLYAFDGTPSAPNGSPGGCTLLSGTPVSLLLSGETAPTCNNLGGGHCLTIAPSVGILGTPAINTTTLGDGSTGGTIYLVAESVSGGGTYYDRLWALDITSLSLTGVTPQVITPTNTSSGNCPTTDTTFSLKHIQRPALLLGGDGYLYIAFSMMDGNSKPYPYGAVFAYNTASLSTAPVCLALSQANSNTTDGAGVWGGGGGPLYAQDPGGSYHIFFNTANGGFDHVNNWGDSFIKMSSASTGGLSINDYYTPGDQYPRSVLSCGLGGDVDFGSGNPMLIPDGENSTWQYLAVSGDKEGGLWFMDWTSPGGYTGTSSCTSGISTNNVQTFQITSSFPNGPLIHTNPAFWENSTTNYLFVGSADDGTSGAGQLMRYQICGTGNPISSTSPCSQAKAVAYESVVASPRRFPWGTTPSISATSVTSPGDAILWAIWADGSVVPASSPFTWNSKGFPAAQKGTLYGFDAANTNDTGMKKLYGSSDCTIGGQLVDQINPATKYSIPTVANGYVYVGTQGPLVDPASCGDNASSTCFSTGSFYIFGHFSTARSCS